MALTEWSETELQEALTRQDEPFAVFVFSPFCGTCRMAERMLEVLIAMWPDMTVVKANIHLILRVREAWRIPSVPCLVFVRNRRAADRICAFHSVPYLAERCRTFFPPPEETTLPN